MDAPVPIWKDFNRSFSHLVAGIRAVKYNYHNSASRNVILRITPDGRSLSYETIGEPQGVLGRLKSRINTINLDKFISLVYGGQSSTFEKRLEKNFQQFCLETEDGTPKFS